MAFAAVVASESSGPDGLGVPYGTAWSGGWLDVSSSVEKEASLVVLALTVCWQS
jgi:hypothetical protein